jgi:hypothetical protein
MPLMEITIQYDYSARLSGIMRTLAMNTDWSVMRFFLLLMALTCHGLVVVLAVDL